MKRNSNLIFHLANPLLRRGGGDWNEMNVENVEKGNNLLSARKRYFF
jgi:hypothetical protein